MPTPQERRPPEGSLDEIALVALDYGRLLMESGASARHVDEIATQVAAGLGAERIDMRLGYASLSITITLGPDGVTRMRRVGPLGVNHGLDLALRAAATRIAQGKTIPTEARDELERLRRAATPHPDWVVAIAVGIACAAFGRLMACDWVSVGPIFAAAALGQLLRRQLAIRKANVFVTTSIVALFSSSTCGVAAQLAGSGTVGAAMVAAVLMLVPGVPALNAQSDILDGHPTLGSARAVWVTVVLIFITVGLWLAQGLADGGR